MNRKEAKRLLKHTALIEAYANGPNGGDQTGVLLEEIPLLDDDEAMKAIATLQARGYSPDDVCKAMEHQPVPTTTGAKP